MQINNHLGNFSKSRVRKSPQNIPPENTAIQSTTETKDSNSDLGNIHLSVKAAISGLGNIQGISPEVIKARKEELGELQKEGEILPIRDQIYQKVVDIWVLLSK
jgi:hypothetical protein